jgi:methionyl-tRNA formyltransferase
VTEPGEQHTRPRTVFLGSGRFGIPALNALAEHPAIQLVGVVTRPPRPAGRGGLLRPSAVGNVARSKWLALLEPRRLRDEDSVAQVASLRPELLVLADYGQLVPTELLSLPAHGALNVHPSLLPRHRGASPIPAAILQGDRESGVTIIRMDQGIDSGPIVAQERVALSGHETAPQLVDRLSALGADLLARSLEPWVAGKLAARPQDEAAASMTRPLRREHGRLDPGRTAAELERQVRAYQPWPGSFVQADGGRVIVWAATAIAGRGAEALDSTRPSDSTGDPPSDSTGEPPSDSTGEPPSDSTGPQPDSTGQPGPDSIGTLVAFDDSLGLVVADGILRLDQVQPAGGRRMSGAELLRGRPGLVGSRVSAGAIA